MKATPTTDFDKIQSGDIATFEMVFRQHYQYLCIQAFNILKDADEAEEIVQDTFVKIWNKREELSITISMKNYLIQSIKNTCFNQIKHEQVKRSYQADFIKSNQEGEHHDQVQVDELEKQIQSAINNLPEERKKVFLLSRKQGLKYQEIARELNISVKTVENQMGKALKFMREELKDYLSIYILALIELLNNYFGQ